MQKKFVFLVTGRELQDGVPAGGIITMIVCAASDKRVREVMGKAWPNFHVTTITGLSALEERAQRIKDALGGKVPEWSVLVDPALASALAAN